MTETEPDTHNVSKGSHQRVEEQNLDSLGGDGLGDGGVDGTDTDDTRQCVGSLFVLRSQRLTVTAPLHITSHNNSNNNNTSTSTRGGKGRNTCSRTHGNGGFKHSQAHRTRPTSCRQHNTQHTAHSTQHTAHSTAQHSTTQHSEDAHSTHQQTFNQQPGQGGQPPAVTHTSSPFST